MTDPLDERAGAVRAMDSRCPHCGAERAPDQAFCVECGYALPPVRGGTARWRRRWVRRLGWYPGDWIWASLLALVVAVGGAAAAVAVAHHRHGGGQKVITALAGQGLAVPVEAAGGTAATLPTPPERTTTTKATGNQAWPKGETGWTIVLVSYPKTAGLPAARTTAAKAARAGLPEVGVLDSSGYASLQSGYFVVFSGVYPSQAEANSAVNNAHAAGFGAAYSRQITG